jgi:uncharacterized membrane protein
VHRGRLEAFSDGVLAIIITIMVLDLRPPHSIELGSLKAVLPNLISYALSFIYIGIYWNNHHHLFQVVKEVNGKILLANLNLLFWLSLTPFATAWLGQVGLQAWPVALYGSVLLLSAVAYTILTIALIAHHGKDSALAKAIGSDKKGKVSMALYALGIVLAFVAPWVSYGLYFVVAVIWIIPDQRIEKVLSK